MTARDPQTAALLAHVVGQVEANVQFLVSQNYISQSDASTFLAKLPNDASPAAAMPRAAPAPARRGTAPAPRGPPVVQARALWPYNEDNAEPNDLSFGPGDIIEIVEETNADWWMGKINGKQALFPSAYVEKLPPTSGPTSPPASGRSMPPAFNPGANTRNAGDKPVYKPFGAAYQGMDTPPPAGGGTNSVGLQQDPGQEQKKSKYGKYGNTMAHSAAGGVGFGAGAAIGGGLVRAIF